MNYNFYGEDIVFPSIKYGENINKLFNLISEGQYESKRYWDLLVKQYKKKTDSKDSGWRGEFWGKLMRSACLIYSYTKNKKLYEVLKHSVLSILKQQDKFGSISTYTIDKQFKGWDMWCRKYIMLGLQYFYEICVDNSLKEKILSALILHADYIMDHVGENKIKLSDTSGIWGALNSSSILQPYVKLYKMTKDKKYLDYAKYIVESNDIEGLNFFYLANRKDIMLNNYPVTKIYEMTSCFEGLLELYEITDDKDYLEMCENFAEKILKDEFTVVGGSGCRSEYFDNSTFRQTIHDPSIEMQETCVTVTMLKYFTKLFFHTKNVKYCNAYERTFFNVYLGSVNEDYKNNKKPVFFSYSPMILSPRWKAIGGKKSISLTKFCGCCICFGGTGLGTLPKMGVILLDNILYINMLCDGDYFFDMSDDKQIKLSISGNYPDCEDIKIAIEKNFNDDIMIKLRKPDWCENYFLDIDGKSISNEEDGYLTIGVTSNKTLCNYHLKMPIRFLYSSKYNSLIDYRVSISKGPVTLALDDCKNDNIIPFDTTITNVKEYKENGKLKYEFPLKNGDKIVLSKYSDSAKSVPTKTETSVWFRIK